MEQWRYGVVLDAGSSGTRVYVYKWPDTATSGRKADNETLHHLPSIEKFGKSTTKPGVSSFAQDPSSIGPNHLQPLLDYALDLVPQNAVHHTPIFLLATAGLRLLPPSQRNALLAEICAYTNTNTDFLLPDCELHVQVISGETEALYGWIASNYLLDGLDGSEKEEPSPVHPTYGFLELGGASAQIAFVPNATEAEKHADDLTLLRLRMLDGKIKEHRVFVTTWLGYGVNAAREAYVDNLERDGSHEHPQKLLDPCLPTGSRTALNGTLFHQSSLLPDTAPYLLGTGDFDGCVAATYPLLDKDAPCSDPPCLFNGTHVPSIDFDVNHFIGVSEYWHTTHDIFKMAQKDQAYNFTTYQAKVSKFCGTEWASIEAGLSQKTWGKKVDEGTALEACFKASWLINLLHSGFGVPRSGSPAVEHNASNTTIDIGKDIQQEDFLEPFQAVHKIKHTEVSWTLGKMVLYASSQIPPNERDSLPVGFGFGDWVIEPATPSSSTNVSSNFTAIGSHGESINGPNVSSFYRVNNIRRIPGFIIFAGLFIMLGLYLCGWRGRSNVPGRTYGSPHKRGRSTCTKLLFPGRVLGSAYERVPEEGLDLESRTTYELDDAESDESEKGEVRGPGLWLPHNQSQSSLMGLGTMDRHGLAVRTESREHLALQSGRKSRTCSPNRFWQGVHGPSALGGSDR